MILDVLNTEIYQTIPLIITFTDWGHTDPDVNIIESENRLEVAAIQRPLSATITRMRYEYTTDASYYFDLFQHVIFDKFYRTGVPRQQGDQIQFAVLTILPLHDKEKWSTPDYAEEVLRPLTARGRVLTLQVNDRLAPSEISESDNFVVARGVTENTDTAQTYALRGESTDGNNIALLLNNHERIHGLETPTVIALYSWTCFHDDVTLQESATILELYVRQPDIYRVIYGCSSEISGDDFETTRSTFDNIDVKAFFVRETFPEDVIQPVNEPPFEDHESAADMRPLPPGGDQRICRVKRALDENLQYNSFQNCAFQCLVNEYECGRFCCCCGNNLITETTAYLVNSITSDCRKYIFDREIKTCWENWLNYNVHNECDCTEHNATYVIKECFVACSDVSQYYTNPLDVLTPWIEPAVLGHYENLADHTVVDAKCIPNSYAGFACTSSAIGPVGGYQPYHHSHHIDDDMTRLNTSFVRLIGGSSTHEGTVEIFYDLTWGTICDNGWDIEDAHVVCRQLGYPGAKRAYLQAYFGEPQEDSEYHLDRVNCLGTERSLEQCDKGDWGVHTCLPFEQAGVSCNLHSSVQAQNILRLVDGTSENQGRIEIFHDGEWGTVCDDNFSLEDGAVVCRQLGYPGVLGVFTQAFFGAGEGLILLDDVFCSGLEYRLDECQFPGWGVHDCSRLEDVGVECEPAPDGYFAYNSNFAVDCQELHHHGNPLSGVYTIHPASLTQSINVYCDMEIDGGGWTVIQRRIDGTENFNRGWQEYRAGFGIPEKEYWLGNEAIHAITKEGRYALRIDFEDFEDNSRAHALYETFEVGSEIEEYRLTIGDFLGGAAGDSMKGPADVDGLLGGTNQKQPFSTIDKKNPPTQVDHCVESKHGGWWFNTMCGLSNLNGVYYDDSESLPSDAMYWKTWKFSKHAIKRVSMKIKIMAPSKSTLRISSDSCVMNGVKTENIFKHASNIEQMETGFTVFILMSPYDKSIWSRDDYLYNYLQPQKLGGGVYLPDSISYSPTETEGIGNYLVAVPPDLGTSTESLIHKNGIFDKMWDSYMADGGGASPEIFMYTWTYLCVSCTAHVINVFGHTGRYSSIPFTIGFTDWGYNIANVNSFRSEQGFINENKKRLAPIERLRIRYTREEVLFFNLFKYTAFPKFYATANPSDPYHDFAVLMVLHPATRPYLDEDLFAEYYLKPLDDHRQPKVPGYISNDIIKPHFADAFNYFAARGLDSGTGTNAAVFKILDVSASGAGTSQTLKLLLEKYEERYGKDAPSPDIVLYTYVYPNTFIVNSVANCLSEAKGDGSAYLGYSTIGSGLFINPASDDAVFKVKGIKALNVSVDSLPPHKWQEYVAPVDKHEDAPGNEEVPDQADAQDGEEPDEADDQDGKALATVTPGGGDAPQAAGGDDDITGEFGVESPEEDIVAVKPEDVHEDTSLIERRPRICTSDIIGVDAVANTSSIADCHSIQSCTFDCLNAAFECGKLCCCCDVNSGPAMMAYLINSVMQDCRYLTFDEDVESCWKTWIAWNVQTDCECRNNDAPTVIYSCLIGASRLGQTFSKPIDVSQPWKLQPPMFRFDDLESHTVVQSTCYPEGMYSGFICAAPGAGPDSGFRPGITGQIGPTDPPTNTSIRLVGANSTFEGTVEIYHSGVWGVICDDEWDLLDAQVVCHQLGFPGADVAFSQAYYGQSPGQFWLDDVDCSGTEKNIDDCAHRSWGEHDCYPFEEAGVKCTQVVGPLPENQIRLVDGRTENEGRVEVYHDNLWGTICDDKFDIKDGIVICQQLGYPSVERVYSRAYFGPGSGRIFMDNLDCSGSESRVDECIFPGWGDNDCSSSEDAGVRCEEKNGDTDAGTSGVARDCGDILRSLQTTSGVYTIKPDSLQFTIDVYCDMDTDGGGWTVIQKRDDGIVDFYQNWNDYKTGFGDINDEFWLGNEVIHRLTNQGHYALRIDLEDFVGNSAYALYDSIVVLDENQDYQILLGNFLDGDAKDSMVGSSPFTTSGGENNRMPFSTYDRKNPDSSQSENCVESRHSGWWFNVECGSSNLNGVYYDFDDEYLNPPHNSIHWYSWTYSHMALNKASMKIKILENYNRK
ncbi:scavenger receptor cysteine-rich domain-containing protein DMBT1-like [Antedon mediterranea]|uniref:scavenger receptor cysteine-rich domain-containing protein DMBT1-like n=1 Tax=Antedon mediterranea TaxID=105859 RepID=UPI003AF61274